MNILLIIEGTYPWYRGGVSEWVYQYLKAQPMNSFSILQIATDEFQGKDPDKALYPLTDNIAEFNRISPPEMDNNWDSDSKDWLNGLKGVIERMVKRNDPEVIHVTNTGFAGWIGSKISDFFEIPMLLTEHAIYWKEIEQGAVALECGYKIPVSERRKQEVIQTFKHMAREVYKASGQVITVSRHNIPFQEELGAENPLYIPNGIPVSWLADSREKNETPTIGWVGRCAEMKNPLKIFEVAEACRSLQTPFRFKVLLSDANEKNLEKKVRETANKYSEVDLIWNQPSEDHYKDFDFLLITSHNESQPLVMLEALAQKVLPVGWKVGDLTGDYGLAVPNGTKVSDLVTAIENLWQDQDRYQRMINQRNEMVRENHVWPTIFDRYLDVFKTLTQQPSTMSL